MMRLAVCDADEARWQAISPRLRGAMVVPAPGCTPPSDCDAALFFLPKPPEPSVIDQCLAARKHVLLAADDCSSASALEAWYTAAQTAGVQFEVANPDRYAPSRQLIHREIAAGKLGEPGLVRIHRWEPRSVEPGKPTALPGALLRDLDLAMWLVGRPVQLVYAVEHAAGDEHPAADRFIQVHLGFPGGAMGLIDYADRLPSGDGYRSLSVIGSAGAAYADDQQNMQLVYRGGRPQGTRTTEDLLPLAALVQEFVDALQAGRDLSASMATWWGVLAVAAAVQQSLAARQAVSLEGA